ncbi:hypothetical protein EHS25_005355 [Saitozyma podzolica]|uniref:FAD-binding FR-type domain-containing protein n=1 Tax=Saitozyma podzolica TaxID=1890683 RepID=A0A427XY20_9TREE|nr:hypothetical protein EHS25_005355 [Saitozyma podzolica]
MALPVGSIRAASRRVLSRSRPTSPSAPAPAPASSPWLLTIRWASSSTPTSPPSPAPARRRGFYLPLSLLLVVPAIYYFYPSSPSRRLSPYTYSDHPVSSTTPLGPSHKELAVPIPRESIGLFGTDAVRLDGTPVKKDDEELVVQHVMVKNPDLQIERPYTPTNDVETDGEMRLVVKRVKGGEVGRLIHSLKPGQDLGVRGPITTFSLVPSAYDKIVMISSGTGIAPFLQLLSKLPAAPPSPALQSPITSSPSPTPSPSRPSSPSASASHPPAHPSLHLIHSLPAPSRPDWSLSPTLLPRVQDRLGDRLVVTRVPPGPIDRLAVEAALGARDGEKVLVLVCLPPTLMRPLCGPLTIRLEQGPVTGLLAELGLSNAEVWKLE